MVRKRCGLEGIVRLADNTISSATSEKKNGMMPQYPRSPDHPVKSEKIEFRIGPKTNGNRYCSVRR